MGIGHKKLALVLSGGGARGAYEAGILHYIRTKLPPEIAHKRPFDILCGSSIGAINVSFQASTTHDLHYQGNRIYQIWRDLKQENVYKRDMGALFRLMGRSFAGMFGNFFRKSKKTKDPAYKKSFSFKGLLDTSPLAQFLKENINWYQIATNIRNGFPKAITMTATNLHSGQLELFIDKHPSMVYAGRYGAHIGPIKPAYALASSAIPILFPSIQINHQYYCDGGLRLNTPLSPAIQMGAEKILVVGLHEPASKKEEDPFLSSIPPTLGEMIGTVFKTIFFDRMDYDIVQMNRLNQVIELGVKTFGDDFLERLNSSLRATGGSKDIAVRGLTPVKVMSIFPSRDIRHLFSDAVERSAFYKKGFTTFEKVLLRMLDVDMVSGLDFLSFILFVPEYLHSLLDLGYEDAKTKHDELIDFFVG